MTPLAYKVLWTTLAGLALYIIVQIVHTTPNRDATAADRAAVCAAVLSYHPSPDCGGVWFYTDAMAEATTGSPDANYTGMGKELSWQAAGPIERAIIAGGIKTWRVEKLKGAWRVTGVKK
jgi:hypothetical protein